MGAFMPLYGKYPIENNELALGLAFGEIGLLC
jgi:hypothetical protein